MLQIVSARVGRCRSWRLAMIGGGLEIAPAIFFFKRRVRYQTAAPLPGRVSRALEAALEGASAFALSMLGDPRPSRWPRMARVAVRRMMQSRRQWRAEARHASAAQDAQLGVA
ncbi:hypothetical protein PQR02_16700 [Paraburkholderia sediminicola]|uniref:Uncharacterized protein n=1 Tax=Paraburkholderia rhynchosiae TaxID=487049 RepID=A0ACC7NLZ9_9BURK